MRTADEDLARPVARGVAWTLLATAAGRLAALASLAILARVLAPADFGLLAAALAYIAYAETLGDLGVGAALIYWSSRREDAAQVTFVVSLALGAFWFTVTVLLAPAVASFFRSPESAGVLRALAWSFPLKALGNTADALVQKDLRFGARFVPEVAQAGVKAVLAVLLAWAGLGVWSLVLAQLAGVAAWTLALWAVVPWRPAWRWPGDLLVPMLTYGRGIVVINVLSAVTHHADLVVVGRRLGVEALGFYQVAYKVPEMSIAILIWAASRVLFPTLVRVHAEGKPIRDAYLTSLRYTSLFTVPMAVGLAVLARPLVRTLFGAPWDPAVPLLQALALYLGLRSLSLPAGDVFKAIGRPGLLASISVVKAAVLLPVLVLLSRFGATAVAVGLAAVTVLTLALSLTVVARWTGATARATWRALEASVLASAVMAAAVGGGLRMMEGWAPPLRVALGLVLGIAAYALTVRLLSPQVYQQALRGFFGPPAPLEAP